MKVGMIIGPCPPGRCGVGDYARRLCRALQSLGLEVEIVSEGEWRLSRVLQNSALLRQLNCDVIHFQYPTVGFGWNLGPQSLSVLRPSIVTIHEASQRRLPRKLSLVPFTFGSQYLIFTNEYEKRFVEKWAPWSRRIASSVIPIGSNIPTGPQGGQRSLMDIIHFGLITPNKGIEDVIELARLAREAGLPVAVHLVGSVAASQERYLDQLREVSANLPVHWHLNLTEQQVAERLSQSAIAYLPYPDGASARRGSLSAALANGLAVITRKGAHMPSALENIVRVSETPSEALTILSELIHSPSVVSEMSCNSIDYAERFSWSTIAESHLKVYEEVSSKTCGRH